MVAIGEPAIPQLVEALADNLGDVVEQAADVLAAIGEPAIPALVDEMAIADRYYAMALG